MDIFAERSVEQATEDAVRFERSIDARSARMDVGFWNDFRGRGWDGQGYVRLCRI